MNLKLIGNLTRERSVVESSLFRNISTHIPNLELQIIPLETFF